jgi:nitrite reductase/ring-hydroxylating ferredoxin subunit
VARVQDVPAGRGWPVRVGDHYVALFRSDGGIAAIENACVHLGNPLDDGAVVEGCVICPWHGWRYDLRTGEHLTAFGRRAGVRTYPVRVEGDLVLVDLEGAPTRG